MSGASLHDNHAHSLRRGFLQLDAARFRACFTESRSPQFIERYVGEQQHYRDMLLALGELLGACGEAAILEKRREFGDESAYALLLLRDVGVESMVIDDGFGGGSMYSIAELRALVGDSVRIDQCRRIEQVLEACLARAGSFEELADVFADALFAPMPDEHARIDGPNVGAAHAPRSMRDAGDNPVALKTIMAYRGGLSMDLVSLPEAKADFGACKAQVAASGRITRCPLYHYFLMQAFELAACHAIPVQVHTGLGDDDALLVESNPALLQPLFKITMLQHTQWVLLHCYPYIREAALMCALYPNVSMDLSLALNLVSPLAAALVREVLACAPASKLLYGSDGHSVPETWWWAARTWRRATERIDG